MNKIGKREKIILALMVVAVLYGAYALFLEPSAQKSKPAKKPAVSRTQEMTQLDTLVTTVAVALKESKQSSLDAYIMNNAQKAWVSDPFYVGSSTKDEKKEKTADEGPNLKYTGYIDHEGGVRLAIINGVDYRVGEALEVPGYRLVSIAPSKVDIEDQEGQRTITVPFVEE